MCRFHTWSPDWIFQLELSRRCKTICWIVHLPIQRMTLAYQWLSQIVSLHCIQFTYTRYMRPRFRHRCTETLFFRVLLSILVLQCLCNIHWTSILCAIDVNRSTGFTMQWWCAYSWMWPFFFSSSILNIINSIFANAPCTHIDSECSACLCVCFRSNGKWHFDFTFASNSFHLINIFHFTIFTVEYTSKAICNCWPLYVILMRLFRIFITIIAINFSDNSWGKSKSVFSRINCADNERNWETFFCAQKISTRQKNVFHTWATKQLYSI